MSTVLAVGRSRNLKKLSIFLPRLYSSEVKITEKSVEEIEIPVPWGHIAGKWWGPKTKRPVLCLHGWQDNANTFDTLIPKLSPELSFLAIDLPGHGLSSHHPKGLFYKTYEIATTIRRVQQLYKWKKVSLLGHSYGAACSFLFSSLFSDTVDFFVAIDAIKPVSRDVRKDIQDASNVIEKLLFYDSFSFATAPSYTKDDILQIWLKATNNSLTENSCKILMERGTTMVDGLFKLTRDCRVKNSFSFHFTQKENLKLAEHVSCNVLLLKSKDENVFEKIEKKFIVDVVNIIKKKAKHFEEHELTGNHYIHLNNPETVAPVINSFIKAIGGQK